NEYRKNPDKYLEQFKKGWEKGRKNSESSKLGELDKKASEKQVPESRKTENGSATPDTGEVWKIDKVTGRIKENSGENDGQTGKTLKDGKSMPRANPPAESGNAFLKLLLGILLLLLGILLLFVAPIIIYILFLFTSPFSAIFAAIALWEAWRINKREEVYFQGPFKLDEEEIDLDKADFDVEKS
ncbi:MAG: hypothetical protein GXP32_04545, partial [Kiritimatiellaeota bacterium]|nr:hypothetical protein [Kiritimatiellota bacterium]